MLTTRPGPPELEALIEEAALTRHPILLHGIRHNAVLLSEEDWHNITETLRRLSSITPSESIPRSATISVFSVRSTSPWACFVKISVVRSRTCARVRLMGEE